MEKLKGRIPKIRFPEFKDEWEHKRLNELLSESRITNTDLKYGKEEVISVSGELGCINQIEHLGRSYAGESVHNYGVVEMGDLVYTKSPLKSNPYGIIKLNKGKTGIVSTLYAVYKIKEKNAIGEFIDYYFSLDANTNRYLRPLVKKGAKNDMKINNSYVLHDRIFSPTIEEQKRIVEFLTIVDNRISYLKKEKDLLENYKKGIIQKIFTKKIRFKDDEGKDFPKWNKKRLHELINIVSGYAFKSEYFSDNGYKLVTPKNFTKNGISSFSFENTKYTTEEVGNQFICKKGDLLLLLTDLTPTCELLGKPMIIREKDGNLLLNQRIIRIDVSDIILNKVFLSNFFLTENCHEIIKKTATGSTVRHSSNNIILKLQIELPCIDEQIKIANFLSSIDKRIDQSQQLIEQSIQWKKGLLQSMFV